MGPNGVDPCGVGVFGNFRSGALRMLHTKVGHLFSGESSWARGRRHNHKLRTSQAAIAYTSSSKTSATFFCRVFGPRSQSGAGLATGGKACGVLFLTICVCRVALVFAHDTSISFQSKLIYCLFN